MSLSVDGKPATCFADVERACKALAAGGEGREERGRERGDGSNAEVASTLTLTILRQVRGVFLLRAEKRGYGCFLHVCMMAGAPCILPTGTAGPENQYFWIPLNQATGERHITLAGQDMRVISLSPIPPSPSLCVFLPTPPSLPPSLFSSHPHSPCPISPPPPSPAPLPPLRARSCRCEWALTTAMATVPPEWSTGLAVWCRSRTRLSGQQGSCRPKAMGPTSQGGGRFVIASSGFNHWLLSLSAFKVPRQADTATRS